MLNSGIIPRKETGFMSRYHATQDVKVQGGATHIAAYAGLFMLGNLADRLGVAKALSAAIITKGEREPVHDRGRLALLVMLMLAMGGTALTDIEYLRIHKVLFGNVASVSTFYRFMRSITQQTLRDMWREIGVIRKEVIRMLGHHTGSGYIYIDLDASLVNIHSQNKQKAAGTYKKGFGFHPIFATFEGEVLAVLMRSGNAAANKISDHLELLDRCLEQIPEEIIADERAHVRIDSAGCSVDIAHGCTKRGMGFSIAARFNSKIHNAVHQLVYKRDVWQAALNTKGETSRRIKVTEITHLVDMTTWPENTRLILRRVRKEGLTAQRSLFPCENYRYQAFYTTLKGDPAAVDAIMRGHAVVEQTIADLKDNGLNHMPFTDFDANSAWVALTAMSLSLTRWFQKLNLTGSLRKAEPKSLRWKLWHVPALVIKSARKLTICFNDTHPSTPHLLKAHQPLTNT